MRVCPARCRASHPRVAETRLSPTAVPCQRWRQDGPWRIRSRARRTTCSSTSGAPATWLTASTPQPLDLDRLAAAAGLSKYHFLRLFRATYGVTPAEYVSRRRIERAQDLLRATNLTVTEVCHAVGFSSLGSFSSRFRAVVGESPSDFQSRYAATGARTSRAASSSCGVSSRTAPQPAGEASGAGPA